MESGVEMKSPRSGQYLLLEVCTAKIRSENSSTKITQLYNSIYARRLLYCMCYFSWERKWTVLERAERKKDCEF